MKIKLEKINAQLILTFIIEILLIRCYSNDLIGQSYLIFILIILWIILALFQKKSITYNIKNLSLAVFLLWIFFLCTIFGELSNGIGNSLRYISLFFGAFLISFYKDDINNLRKVFFVAACTYGYYVVKSIIYYTLHPNVARLIISHHTDEYSQVALGGAYGLAYGAALIIVFIFMMLLLYWRCLNKKIKFFGIISSILMFILCVQIESTITIISILFGVLITLVLYSRQKGRKSLTNGIITLFVLVILLIVVILVRDKLADWLLSINISSSSSITDRIHELAISIKSSMVTGVALSGRIKYYNIAIETIIRNPILGSIFYNGYPTQIGLSGHSELLDVFALYGFFVGLPFCIWYFSNIKLEMPIIRVGYYFTAVCLLLLNQFTYTSGSFALFFFVPAGCLLLKHYFPEY